MKSNPENLAWADLTAQEQRRVLDHASPEDRSKIENQEFNEVYYRQGKKLWWGIPDPKGFVHSWYAAF